jgi:hypothetical protein
MHLIGISDGPIISKFIYNKFLFPDATSYIVLLRREVYIIESLLMLILIGLNILVLVEAIIILGRY